MNEEQEQKSEPAWCIAANIVHERDYGPGGVEKRRGTKQFAPGAKVYIVNFNRGFRANITVIGRQRKSHRYITLITEPKWLVNWRVELVYSPYVLKALLGSECYMPAPPRSIFPWKHQLQPDWPGSPAAKALAEHYIEDAKKYFPSASHTQSPGTRPSDQ